MAVRKRESGRRNLVSAKDIFFAEQPWRQCSRPGICASARHPQGRSLAQSILNSLPERAGDTLPASDHSTTGLGGHKHTWEHLLSDHHAAPRPSLSSFSVDCGDLLAAKCSIEQIRSKVNSLSKNSGPYQQDYIFIGATGGPRWQSGSVRFKRSESWAGISEERWTGKPVQEHLKLEPGGGGKSENWRSDG